MSRRLIPDWRWRYIVRALDDIELLPTLAPLSPEPGDTGEMLDLKRKLRGCLRTHADIIAFHVATALNPRARRSALGEPYLPPDGS